MEMSFKCLVKVVLQYLDNILTFFRFGSGALTESSESGAVFKLFQIQVNFKYLPVVLRLTWGTVWTNGQLLSSSTKIKHPVAQNKCLIPHVLVVNHSHNKVQQK